MTQAQPMDGLTHANRKRYNWLLICLLLLGLSVALSLFIGAKPISALTVWQSLFGVVDASHTVDAVIILEGRIPRTLMGLLVGVGLGISGAVIQAVTRNPLADPGIFGVNAGASFAVVIGIVFFGASYVNEYIWFAFIGTALTTILVFIIGTFGPGQINPMRLTLSGVALGAVLSGFTSALVLQNPMVFDDARFWSVGTLDVRDLTIPLLILPAIVTGSVIALLLGRSLNAMSLGDDLAQSLGTRPGVTQLLSLLSITLLCGAATAAAGPIGFIGLMMPHVSRWMVGPDQRWILPFTMILTPVLLLCSDVIGRVIVAGEMRVAIVTAFIGAPILIWLVRMKREVSELS